MRKRPSNPDHVIEAARKSLEDACANADKALHAFPGTGSGPMGLTPDHVRANPEWAKLARASLDAFHALRRFNTVYKPTRGRRYLERLATVAPERGQP